ncbi:acetyl-CoA synthetase-like protein, partial [Paraphaeosphaeria sporulosa]
GNRLMPVMVDEVAAETPDRVCFSIPRSTDLKAGFHDITFQTFANAINKTASFIEREIGRSSMFETVMYMGIQDVRYFIVLFALMKTGHKVLFSSHRNSVAGHTDLVKQTDCGIIMYTNGLSCAGIIEASRMETLCMPELDYLFDDSVHTDPYPYTKTFEQAKHHPCMVTHTTNSTGMPKPVIWTHWLLATTDAQRLVPDFDGRPTVWNKVFDSSERCYSGVPICDSAGIVTALVEVLLNGCTVVLGPPNNPTANTFEQVVTYGRVDAASLLPRTLEEIASSQTGLALLSRLKYVAYAAGSLSPRAGEILSRYTHLYSLMVSTETGSIIQHATDREDWQYMCINPKYNGIEWRPRGSLYELVFKKSNDLADVQGIFKTSLRSQECSMGDLYSKHPTKPHHWKHEGRTDD